MPSSSRTSDPILAAIKLEGVPREAFERLVGKGADRTTLGLLLHLQGHGAKLDSGASAADPVFSVKDLANLQRDAQRLLGQLDRLRESRFGVTLLYTVGLHFVADAQAALGSLVALLPKIADAYKGTRHSHERDERAFLLAYVYRTTGTWNDPQIAEILSALAPSNDSANEAVTEESLRVWRSRPNNKALLRRAFADVEDTLRPLPPPPLRPWDSRT